MSAEPLIDLLINVSLIGFGIWMFRPVISDAYNFIMKQVDKMRGKKEGDGEIGGIFYE